MKKLITIAAMTMLVGATVSWAQVTNLVNRAVVVAGPINIDVKVTLSDKTKPVVTNAIFAEVQLGAGSSFGSSGDVFDVIGTAITQSTLTTNLGSIITNTITTDVSSNVFLSGNNPVDLGKGKFAEVFFGPSKAPFGMSNSVWFVNGAFKDSSKGTNISAKVEGIWKDGDTAFKGSIKNSKK